MHLKEDPHYYDGAKDKARQTINRHKAEDPLYQQKITAKSRTTKKKNYGDENYMQFGSNSFYDLMRAKHGDPHWNNPEKNMQTCMDKYGTPTYMPYGSQKFKERMIELYGVEHNSQVHDIRVKQH